MRLLGFTSFVATLQLHSLFWVQNNAEVFKVAFLYSSQFSAVWPQGMSAAYSADIALSKIRESDILPPGVDMELVFVPTDCDANIARDSVMQLIKDDDIKVFIGPPCRAEAEDVLGFLAHPHFRDSMYRKPFVLSTASEYFPMVEYQDTIVRRLIPTDERSGDAFLAYFDWKRYGRIFDEHFFETIITYAEDEAIHGVQSAMFYYDKDQSPKEISRGLETFQENDVKIVLLSTNREIAKLVCVAESMGMFGSDYVWYARSWVWDNLIESSNMSAYCTDDQIQSLKAADGFFAVEATPETTSTAESGVNITRMELYNRIQENIEKDLGEDSGFEPTVYDLYVYDAVWLVANTIEDIWNISGYQNLFDAFFESTKSKVFKGLSGKISYGDGPNPLESCFALRQFKGFENIITLAEGSIDELEMIEEVSWVGGSKPTDFTPKVSISNRFDFQLINLAAAISVDVATFIVFLLCIFCLIVNNVWRKRRMVKITSPMINNVILFGVILVLSTVAMGSYLAFDHDPDVFLFICYARDMLLAVGFTFAFGGLFCKTWRVYRAFTSKSADKQVVISDFSLVRKIGILLILDVLYIIMKPSLDPFSVEKVTVDVKVTRDEENSWADKMHWMILQCESKYGYFEIILAAGKFLVVLFGVFLSFETRNVHVDELNDSKTIAVSIYNVVICCVFGALTMYTAGEDQLTLNYVLRSVVVLFCTAVLVSTHFLPHQIKVLRTLSEPDDVNIRITGKSASASHATKN